MAWSGYISALQKELLRADSASVKGGKTRGELETEIAEITAALSGPLSNADRIWLVGYRRELRRELAALTE
jgi:hypothetical protein